MQNMQHNTAGMSLLTQWALALQHLLAIFAGTVFVPLITGLPISTALLFTGISTLVFQYFTRFKIPLFFGSSFVFIGAMMLIKQKGIALGMTPAMALCYASFGIFVSGLIFIICGQIARRISYQQITKFAPPVLYGSFIISLGIVMAGDTFSQLSSDWLAASVAIVAIIVMQFFCRGVIRLLPLAIGMLCATIVVWIEGNLDFSMVAKAEWLAMPFEREYMALSIFEQYDSSLLCFSILTVIPLVVLSLVEHIADLYAISRTTKVNYIRSVGLPRTLSANGISTVLSALCGGPAATSYTQITGLIAMNRKCAPHLLTLAAVLMILISFSPKLSAVFFAIPMVATGAATLVMCCVVIIVGIRSMMVSHVDFSNRRNLLISGVMIGLAVIIKFIFDDQLTIFGLELSSLTVSAIVGVILNMTLSDKSGASDITICD